MKKIVMNVFIISAQLQAMNQLIPSADAAKIFATSMVMPVAYGVCHNVATALYAPEALSRNISVMGTTFENYKNSSPNSVLKKICRKAQTPLQKGAAYVLCHGEKDIWLTTVFSLLLTASARAGSLPASSYNQMLVPMALGVSAVTIYAMLRGYKTSCKWGRIAAVDDAKQASYAAGAFTILGICGLVWLERFVASVSQCAKHQRV